MSLEPIRAEVRGLLAETNFQISQTERMKDQGVGLDRVRAAGRLVQLDTRKGELESRLNELKLAHEGVAQTVVQWIKEDWMLVSLYFTTFLQTQ